MYSGVCWLVRLLVFGEKPLYSVFIPLCQVCRIHINLARDPLYSIERSKEVQVVEYDGILFRADVNESPDTTSTAPRCYSLQICNIESIIGHVVENVIEFMITHPLVTYHDIC